MTLTSIEKLREVKTHTHVHTHTSHHIFATFPAREANQFALLPKSHNHPVAIQSPIGQGQARHRHRIRRAARCHLPGRPCAMACATGQSHWQHCFPPSLPSLPNASPPQMGRWAQTRRMCKKPPRRSPLPTPLNRKILCCWRCCRRRRRGIGYAKIHRAREPRGRNQNQPPADERAGETERRAQQKKKKLKTAIESPGATDPTSGRTVVAKPNPKDKCDVWPS